MKTSNKTLDQQMLERDAMIRVLKDHLHKAQERMKKFADRKRREVSFEEGEWMFLKIRPYWQASVVKKRNEKLSPKFFGPYKISSKIGSVAYQLALPKESMIHPVFHVSQLKKALGNHQSVQEEPPVLTDDFEWVACPEEVFAAHHDYTEVLICWRGLPEHEATWEKWSDIQIQFPDFNLEDMVFN